MDIFIKMRFFITKKDGFKGPTALESDGSYFEIMGQKPRPTINLKACTCLQIRGCSRNYFFYSTKTYVVGTKKNCLNEMGFLSTKRACIN